MARALHPLAASQWQPSSRLHAIPIIVVNIGDGIDELASPVLETGSSFALVA
jgi:hypothetical protein